MDAIEKIIKAVRAELTNRFTNQFIVSFYFAVVILNWKIVLIVFSKSLDTSAKISMISGNLNWLDIAFYPLLAALVYAIVSPLTAVGSNTIWAIAKKWINIASRKQDNDTYLEIDVARKLREQLLETNKSNSELFKDVFDQKEKHQQEIGRLENLIREGDTKTTRLNETIEQLNANLRTSEEKYFTLTNRNAAENLEQLKKLGSLTELLDQKTRDIEALNLRLNKKLDVGEAEKTILDSLIKNNVLSQSMLGTILHVSDQKSAYHLEKLLALGYVGVVDHALKRYELTPNGRAYYYENLDQTQLDGGKGLAALIKNTLPNTAPRIN